MLKTYYLNTKGCCSSDYVVHVTGCPRLPATDKLRLLGVFFNAKRAEEMANIMGYERIVFCECCRE